MRSPHDSASVASRAPSPSPRSAWRSPSRLRADATVRLNDVASLQGAAPVPLIGYGLVVGLNKTGRPAPDDVLRADAGQHARALRRAGAGRGDQDREHRRGAGHRGAAGVLAPGQPPRRHRVVDRRRPQPAGRHAAADAAARHRRHHLRAGAGPAVARRLRRRQGRELGAGEPPHRRPRAGRRDRPGRARQHRAGGDRDDPALARRARLHQRDARRRRDQRRARARERRGRSTPPASRCRCRRTTAARCRT